MESLYVFNYCVCFVLAVLLCSVTVVKSQGKFSAIHKWGFPKSFSNRQICLICPTDHDPLKKASDWWIARSYLI